MSDNNTVAVNAVSGIGVIFISISAIFFFTIFAAFSGALSGWIIGLVFGNDILAVLGCLGIKGVTMWQIGATVGWLGGFLKTNVTVTK